MNQAELSMIVQELETWVGSPLTGAWQPRRDRVVLGLSDSMLLMVPRGPHARVHLTDRRPRNPPRPFSFQGACRAHLHGRLRSIHLDPQDRIVEIAFTKGALHLRLTGRVGGLWLLDDQGTVLAAYDGPAPTALPALRPPPAPPEGANEVRFPLDPDQGANRSAARWFGRLESQARRTEQRRDLERRLRDQLKRDRRLTQALHRDLDKASRADEARLRADALASSLHLLSRGQAEVVVPDPYEPSRPLTLTVDPAKSPGDNLSALYGRARRLDRMGERVLEHLERVEQRSRAVEAAMIVLAEADDETLEQIERLVPRQRRRRPVDPDAPWITWTSETGREILVGRNAAGNRRLTFQRARASDFWMHLRGRPGAHLVIPCDRGHSPDLDTLLAAAQIVGVHAKIAEGSAYEVQYTRANQIRSIKGAADGKVIVHEERVLRVVRDPTALAGWRREDQDALDVAGLTELSSRGEEGSA